GGGAVRRSAADGAGQRRAHRTAGAAARDRRELSAAQVQRELPRAPGPARGHGEPHRGAAPGLQRRGQPVQRLHPAVSAGVDGEAAREGAASVLRAGARRRASAEGELLEVKGGQSTIASGSTYLIGFTGLPLTHTS